MGYKIVHQEQIVLVLKEKGLFTFNTTLSITVN